MINYLKGKLTQQNKNSFIFECNNIGYKMKGVIQDNSIKQIFIHTITNSRTYEQISYGFKFLEYQQKFIELLKIKGFGPASAIKLLSMNTISDIEKAISTGNLIKLNSEGIKPSILTLIVAKENIDKDSMCSLILTTLEKYGFKTNAIKQSIVNAYNPAKNIDKNIKEIIIDLNSKVL